MFIEGSLLFVNIVLPIIVFPLSELFNEVHSFFKRRKNVVKVSPGRERGRDGETVRGIERKRHGETER